MRCVIVPEGAPPATQRAYSEILAVHAALLHTGKIVFFSGDEHDPGRHHLGMFDHARLFDCNTLAVTTPATFPATPAPATSAVPPRPTPSTPSPSAGRRCAACAPSPAGARVGAAGT